MVVEAAAETSHLVIFRSSCLTAMPGSEVQALRLIFLTATPESVSSVSDDFSLRPLSHTIVVYAKLVLAADVRLEAKGVPLPESSTGGL